MAVAISARSAERKPSFPPSVRPAWRAVRMSMSDLIATRISSAITHAPLELVVEQAQPLLEVERRLYLGERDPELHHRERHLRLNTDNHRLGPAQPQRRRDRP